ncbi:MAG: alpha/beta fold hydrolase [Dehalococcoidia bacterium]
MPTVNLPGVDLYYEVHGPEGAPAIVFAHGAGGNHISWWQQVPHFARRHRCVTFDHRGFGQSRGLDGRASEAFVDDLTALLDSLAIVRATFVAQSMGGWTCLNFALRDPVRVERLLMADTHGGLRSPAVDAALAAARQSPPPSLPEGVHIAAGPTMAEEQPELAFLYGQVEALNPRTDPGDLRRRLASIGEPAAEDVAKLTFPVLFVVGEEDPLIPPPVIEAAAACFPNARVERVPRTGHSVYWERAARFNELLEAFLTEG